MGRGTRSDNSELVDLFRSAVADSGERARAETGMFLSFFREHDAKGADRFLETFKARAGGREAERIRQVADFQAARERQPASAQPAQPQSAQAAPANPQPQPPQAAPAKPQPQPAQAAPAKPQSPQPSARQPAAQPTQPAPAQPSAGPRDDGRNPNFTRFRQSLKQWEGGFANRSLIVDPGGPTQKGISQKFLNDLNKQHPKWGLPKASKNLTDAQIDGIYRKEFFDKPNIQKVVDIPGLQQQAPKLAGQLFDSGVLHGTAQAGKLLQQSLDQVLGTDLKVTDDQGRKFYDGIVGSGTRAVIGQAVRNGKAPAVNDLMVSKRVALMRTLSNFPANPNWMSRAESFKTRTP